MFYFCVFSDIDGLPKLVDMMTFKSNLSARPMVSFTAKRAALIYTLIWNLQRMTCQGYELCSCFMFCRRGETGSQLCLSCHHSLSLEVFIFWCLFCRRRTPRGDYEVPQHALLAEYLTFCFKKTLFYVFLLEEESVWNSLSHSLFPLDSSHYIFYAS